jgi:hypothetical protein
LGLFRYLKILYKKGKLKIIVRIKAQSSPWVLRRCFDFMVDIYPNLKEMNSQHLTSFIILTSSPNIRVSDNSSLVNWHIKMKIQKVKMIMKIRSSIMDSTMIRLITFMRLEMLSILDMRFKRN